MMPPAAAVLTVEYKVNFISPALGELLGARMLKPGAPYACYAVHAHR
jgi:hypothetical protein